MYDAIIVGAVCGLANRHAPGATRVRSMARRRWGLLGTLAATGAPPICRHMTFDVGPFALRGAIPDANDAQGISDAFIETEMLATAFSTVWSGAETLEARWAAHEAARNERVRPMYESTGQLAALEPPPPEMRALFGALRCGVSEVNDDERGVTSCT